MKLYMRGIAAFVLSVGAVAVVGGGSVNAQDCSADMNNTGPGSVNTVDCEVTNSNRYICRNNIWVENDNYQEAESGDSEVEGNTSGGGAASGDASNSNETNATITVGGSCGAVTTGGGGGGGGAAPTPTPTPTPDAPRPVTGMGAAGGGMGAAMPVAAVLPDTANTSFSSIAAVVAGSLLALGGIAKLGTFAYGNYMRSRE